MCHRIFLWESFECVIGGETIKYCSLKKRNLINSENHWKENWL